jgi:uncharacterized protein
LRESSSGVWPRLLKPNKDRGFEVLLRPAIMNQRKSVSREFQVLAKPVGPLCNMGCDYCYYLEKEQIFPVGTRFRMPEVLLEEYIVQHLEASTEEIIQFSWHGGEPTLAGIDYFRKIVELQQKHVPAGRRIQNGIQTNGTLLNQEWCRFLKKEHFMVGISIDGPQRFHDRYRHSRDHRSMYDRTIQGYFLLRKFGIHTEVLCVVNAFNVAHPIELYRFFRQLEVEYITFLPLVEPLPGSSGKVSERSVPSGLFGEFLCIIFDKWKEYDIGKIKIQVFEEAIRTAFSQEHTLCIFKPICGGVPVMEHNGNFYSCDHFVDDTHLLGNILENTVEQMLDSQQQKDFGMYKKISLPSFCLECEVLEMCNGECPKNRIMCTPTGEEGLNYLCPGYRKFFNYCRPFIEEVSLQWKKN